MPSSAKKTRKTGPKKGVPRALPRRLDDEFAGRFRQAMAVKQFTEISLAKAAGCTKQAIFKYLKGESRTIEALLLLRLADELGVSARWLLTGAGEVAKPQSLDPEQLRCLNVLARMPLEQMRDRWISLGEDLASIQPTLFPSAADPFRGLVPPTSTAPSVHEPSREPYLGKPTRQA
jgi:transcriptional regulator with XRE-family HTH domain